ncbi:MAG: AAA family ATPase [Paenalcaligenes sp.]
MTKFIAVTGTHSTGKSTFVKDLTTIAKKRGLRVGTVQNNASECAKSGFPILKDHTFSSTLWIMATVIRAEQHEGLNADLVIVDRPVSDAIGYLEAALTITGRNMSATDRSYLYALAKLHSSRYDLLFKTVLDESVPLGPGRDPDLNYRKAVDSRIDAALFQLGLQPLNPLNDGDRSQALELIDLIANEINHPH